MKRRNRRKMVKDEDGSRIIDRNYNTKYNRDSVYRKMRYGYIEYDLLKSDKRNDPWLSLNKFKSPKHRAIVEWFDGKQSSLFYKGTDFSDMFSEVCSSAGKKLRVSIRPRYDWKEFKWCYLEFKGNYIYFIVDGECSFESKYKGKRTINNTTRNAKGKVTWSYEDREVIEFKFSNKMPLQNILDEIEKILVYNGCETNIFLEKALASIGEDTNED